MTMTGEKVKLRALEPTDIDALYEWENDCGIWYLSNTLAPVSRFVLEQYLLSSHQDIYTAKQLRLMIEASMKDSYVPAGLVDLFDFDPNHLRAGVGIMVAGKYRRKGYATEALALLIRFCFDTLHLHQLYCHIPGDNDASMRLFKRHGFEITGRFKQWSRGESGWNDVFFMQLVNDRVVAP